MFGLAHAAAAQLAFHLHIKARRKNTFSTIHRYKNTLRIFTQANSAEELGMLSGSKPASQNWPAELMRDTLRVHWEATPGPYVHGTIVLVPSLQPAAPTHAAPRKPHDSGDQSSLQLTRRRCDCAVHLCVSHTDCNRLCCLPGKQGWWRLLRSLEHFISACSISLLFNKGLVWFSPSSFLPLTSSSTPSDLFHELNLEVLHWAYSCQGWTLFTYTSYISFTL